MSVREQTLDRLERAALAGVYALATIAGPLAILNTPPTMQESLGGTFANLWGVYLFLGGIGCLVGVILGSWLPEFLFINLLGSATTVYGVVVLSTIGGEPGRAAAGLLLLAFSCILFVVWIARYRTGRSDRARHQVE